MPPSRRPSAAGPEVRKSACERSPATIHRIISASECRAPHRRAACPGQEPSRQPSFDLGQAPVQSESNSAKGWITANWVGCSPNDRAQSTGRKRHVSLCSTGSCSTRSSYCQPHPGRRVRAPWGWWRIPRRWRLPRRRRPCWRRSPRWSLCRSRRRGSRGLPRRVLSTSRIRCGGGGRRSGWCRGLRRSLRRLQQLLRRVRQLYLRPVSILTRAERMPTAVGPVLTAVPFSCVGCRNSFSRQLDLRHAPEGRSISLAGVAARLAACAANADFYRAQTASKLSSISAIVLTPHNPIVVSISLARMSSALATPACPPAPRP